MPTTEELEYLLSLPSGSYVPGSVKELGEVVAPFDPEGSGYDYKTAIAAGIRPDETGHWPSRLAGTGQILKGQKHATYHLTAQGEKEAGHVISKGADGRYYSFPAETE